MSKKRYTTDNGSNEDVCLVDNVTGKEFESDFDEIVDLLNEQEDKLKRIEKEVDCNIYRDDLKDIILEIRCILNGDVE